MQLEINYNPEPTLAKFHLDDTYFRCLIGPVGSGKSSGCVMEMLLRAHFQIPFKGVRKSRWGVVRETYPELKSTTIKTFQKWLPHAVCPLVYDVPIRGTYNQHLSDGTRVEAEFLFIALETEEDVKKLLSLDLTGIWLNEVRQLNEEVFKYARGRISRYPPMDEGGPTWKGIIADTNPPKTTHWIYRVFEEESHPDQFKLFRQPPAVFWDNETQKWEINPDAENIQWLDTDYYKSQLAGTSDDYIRVMLAGEYGMTQMGKAVYPQYSEKQHVATEEILPNRGAPLILGFDFGLNPACVFAQMTKLGGLVILDALAPADEDLETFCDEYVLPLIGKKYANFKIQAVGDPSARGRSDLDKRTPFDVLASRGIRCVGAHTNFFIPRKEAVDNFLNKINGFKLNPHITYLREAFGGGYVYSELKGNRGMFKERPDKTNPYTHGIDAVQYICLYVKYSSGAKWTRSRKESSDKKFLWA